MPSPSILVTGADGQLGRELQDAAGVFTPRFDFRFCTRRDLSIDNAASIQEQFDRIRPAWCVNCAAYTAVDKAESEKETAFRINGEAVGVLAETCRSWDTKLIHISTDYVFDGSSATPLKEGDPTGPLSVYGASKLMGEELAQKEQPDSVIIRTSWVYSAFGNNFVKTMIRLMKERPMIRVVNDQIGSPTYAADLATAILRIIDNSVFHPGVYHYSNEGRISWYEFAQTIAALTHSVCQVEPIPTTDYPTPARRPHYSLLDKDRIKKVYDIPIPGWKDSLQRCLERLGALAGSGDAK